MPEWTEHRKQKQREYNARHAARHPGYHAKYAAQPEQRAKQRAKYAELHPAIAKNLVCLQCSEPSGNAKWCSSSCYGKWHREQNPKLPARPCQWCRQPFVPRSVTSTFCCRKCKCKWHKHRHKQTARAAKKATPDKLTEQQWQHIQDAFNGLCAYCPEPATSQDHVMPLSRGGMHDASNVVPACAKCNSRKGSRTPEEWGHPVRFAIDPKIEKR